MAVLLASYVLSDISAWPHVAGAWHNPILNRLHVKVAYHNTDRVIQFDLDATEPDSVSRWVAFEVMKTAAELRDIEEVRKRLTA